MENAYQETRSIWQKTEAPFLPSLNSHETVDVCIVGAGLAGLTTAYRLLESGRSVVVLDRYGLHGGQSVLTTAHLCSALDDRYFSLKRMHGEAGIRAAAHSHSQAVDEIERIVSKESIDCEFQRVPGHLFLAPGHEPSLLEEELAACHEAGLVGVEKLANVSSPLFSPGPCLRFPHQARFHPARYLTGLARAVLALGGRIFSHTEAGSIEGGKPARVITNRGFQVISDAVVAATNVPFNDRFSLHTKMTAYRTYVIGLAIPSSRLDHALFWDSGDPYHYMRTCRDSEGQDILLVGGEDHRTGEDPGPDRFRHLADWCRDRIGLRGPVRYRWSGQVMEPHDGLAFIGANPGDEDNVFVVTGDSGNGLTHGTIAGMLLTDLINGRSNPWASLYDPSRINISSLSTFLSENAKTAAGYADWLSGGDVATADDIPRREGAVLREGMQKVAAYRDDAGCMHFYSAVCPHMSGIVRWNQLEKTWDCPCHGSRFDRYGNVINGPAATGLREIGAYPLRRQDPVSA